MAQRAAVLARQEGDKRAASMAARASGLAARELNDLPTSGADLRRAIRLAERHGYREEGARARMLLVGTLAMEGDWAGALRQVDRAAPALNGHDLDLLRLQRGTVLVGQGRPAEAIAAYSLALPALRRSGEDGWAAVLLTNRGMARCHQGELAAAMADLRQAESLFDRLGQSRAAARVHQSLGVVASRLGDIPAALDSFDRAEAWFTAHDRPESMLFHDRCDALLGARLLAESRACAETAVRLLSDEGRHGYAATARLKLAESALAAGDVPAARAAADEAARILARQRRPALAAQAVQISLQAAWAAGERTPALLARVRRNAESLEAAQFKLQAVDARLLAAQLATELGRPRVAAAELSRARRAGRNAPAQIRIRAWQAEALLRLSTGNARGAESALRAGMRVADRHRITLGATELRANAGGHVVGLAHLGLGLALEHGDARRVLAWAERGRAGSALLRPARPPGDDRLAASLGALRAVVAELDAAAAAGRSTARLVARQAALEQAVRDRARCATGVLAATAAPAVPLDALLAALGGASAVELVEHAGTLHGVVAREGKVRVRALAPAAGVADELERLRFSLRRLAFPTGTAAHREAARRSAAHGAEVLDDLLLAPLGIDGGDRPLVIVPTGNLHAVPWAALPSCRGRSVSVAPSLSAWHRAATAPAAAGGPPFFTAGPNLEHATAEVRALARSYPGARRLTGRRATCGAVLAGLDGAGLAHIAAHGHFRADNPLFSCLDLADGPLTVYDIEALRQAPAVLVLAACDAGLSDVRPGDELMGLAAAVLALGTRALVASVFPVPDEDTRSLMVAFHAGIRSGLGPAAALAAAQAGAAGSWPLAGAFACYGAG